ncbi:MAG TPA: hypothetical protein VNU46_04390 [Gemmatimonadaceae bacterium]|jgi:hypothetical protein|nr:hypothetical protein [Gemmatimonadaceae bacterium]
MSFLSVVPRHLRDQRRRCATPQRCRHAQCHADIGGQGRHRAATLGAYLHVAMPAIVVGAALVLQALHNALPFVTLVALVSAAYGRLLWLEFLEHERGLVRDTDHGPINSGTAPQVAPSEGVAR